MREFKTTWEDFGLVRTTDFAGTMLNIALFGTSADPPTAGHLAILKWLASHYDLVAVWASDNPFKQCQTPLDHRMSMLNLLIREAKQNNIELHKDLSDQRSLLSVRKAQTIWGKDHKYYLVIGSDLLGQLPCWYQSVELFKLAEILIIPRPNYPIDFKDIDALQLKGAKWQIADLQGLAVSSTDYRLAKVTEILIQPVKDYIQKRHLYEKRTD